MEAEKEDWNLDGVIALAEADGSGLEGSSASCRYLLVLSMWCKCLNVASH